MTLDEMIAQRDALLAARQSAFGVPQKRTEIQRARVRRSMS
jgi:hypothetical protein